jgi:hypothetical protein
MTDELNETPSEYCGPDGGLLILSAVIPVLGFVIGIGYCIASKPKKGLPLIAAGLATSIIVFAIKRINAS